MPVVRIAAAASLCMALCACATVPFPPSAAGADVSPDASISSLPPPGPTTALGSRSVVGFLRDGELVLLHVESRLESATGITDFRPHAFTRDRDALVGIRSRPDDPRVSSIVWQPIDAGPSRILVDEHSGGGGWASPDGGYVAYESDGVLPNGLVLVDLATGETSQLTTDGAVFPIWSPDSSAIVYLQDPTSAARDVRVVDVETGAVRQLVGSADHAPIRWSDNGRAVLTRSCCEEGTESTVWQVDAETRDMTHRPDLEDDLRRNEWTSPDGRWIARISDDSVLSLIEANSGEELRLGTGDPRTELTWSPDGDSLVWTEWSGFDGAADLFMIHAGSGDRIQLTRTLEDEASPVWGFVRHGF